MAKVKMSLSSSGISGNLTSPIIQEMENFRELEKELKRKQYSKKALQNTGKGRRNATSDNDDDDFSGENNSDDFEGSEDSEEDEDSNFEGDDDVFENEDEEQDEEEKTTIRFD